MGTPHLRCREMHQSLRPSVIAVMRFSPTAGTQLTARIASSACCLRGWNSEFGGRQVLPHPAPGRGSAQAPHHWASRARARRRQGEKAVQAGARLKPSTLANHWSVARKMVGFLVRQS